MQCLVVHTEKDGKAISLIYIACLLKSSAKIMSVILGRAREREGGRKEE